MADTEDPRIQAITRQVMEDIRACTPGARLADVPTLFAYGPIYRALYTKSARVAALEAETQQLRESGRVNLAGKWAAEEKVARLEAETQQQAEALAGQSRQLMDEHTLRRQIEREKARLEAENAQLLSQLRALVARVRKRYWNETAEFVCELEELLRYREAVAPPAPPGDQT